MNERWDNVLQKYFHSHWTEAKRVLMCESGGQEDNIGPRDSQGFHPIGLMQIKNFAGRPSTVALMDGETNIRYASQMYQAQGWTPWECAEILHIQ